jgi:3',5'-cyclic-AMP phosphodiesterase
MCGNHDRAFLSSEDNAAALGSEVDNRVVEIAGVRLMLWQPNVRVSPGQGSAVAPADLDWLGDSLVGSSDPVLLFSHVPLSGQSMAGNDWFEYNPSGATYAEQPQIRRVLARYSGAIAAVAGHVHWNSVTIVDSIPHFTVQSLTETFTTFPDPAGSFALLELADATLRWTVHGRDPFDVTLAFPSQRRRWIEPRQSDQTCRST